MSPFEVRRRTAEKLANPPKAGALAPAQKPIEGCVIPAPLKGRLDEIRARCSAQVEAREQAGQA